jgi:hypothetical protein
MKRVRQAGDGNQSSLGIINTCPFKLTTVPRNVSRFCTESEIRPIYSLRDCDTQCLKSFKYKIWSVWSVSNTRYAVFKVYQIQDMKCFKCFKYKICCVWSVSNTRYALYFKCFRYKIWSVWSVLDTRYDVFEVFQIQDMQCFKCFRYKK